LQIVRDGLRKLKKLAPANRWGEPFDFLSRIERIAQNASRIKQIDTPREFSVENQQLFATGAGFWDDKRHLALLTHFTAFRCNPLPYSLL
jgi:hypothetical protein